MKKVVTALLIAGILLVGTFAVACGASAKNIKSFTVKEGTAKTEYNLYDKPDYSGIKLILIYTDDSTAETDAGAATFSGLDTMTLGDQTVTVTYQGLTATYTVTVIDILSTDAEITGFEEPAFVTQYKTVIKGNTNKEAEFTDLTSVYKVGDDNGFVMFPKVTLLKPNLESVVLARYTSDITVEEKNGDTYTVLTGDTLAAAVVIDAQTGSFDFTDAAIGKEYRITMRPAPEHRDDSIVADDKVVLTVGVIDGYNIYDVKGLSRVNNTNFNVGMYPKGWSEYKTANGIVDTEVSGIVMHDNISVANKDIPQEFFWKVGDEGVSTAHKDYDYISKNGGALRNRVYIYSRYTPAGQTFTFEGNYFTLDASQVSVVTREDDQYDASQEHVTAVHSSLFGFIGNNNTLDGASESDTGKNILRNVNLIGNANRDVSEGETTLRAGGLILNYTSCKEQLDENLLVKSFVTNYLVVNKQTKATLSNSKYFDTYSLGIYVWRTAGLYLNNSVIKRCGGPIFVMDVSKGAADDDSYVEVSADSVLSNLVTGREVWFIINGFTPIVGPLLEFNQAVVGGSTAFGQTKSYVDGNGLVDLIGAVKAYETDVTQQIKGCITIKGSTPELDHSINMTAMRDSNKIVADDHGGRTIINRNSISAFFDQDQGNFFKPVKDIAAIGPEDAPLFLGDGKYLNILTPMNGVYMGLMVGYNDYVPAS